MSPTSIVGLEADYGRCQGLTDLAHQRIVGDMTFRLRPHVLLSLRGAMNSKHAAGIRIMT
jgi:hypothetical protein